MSLFTLLQSSWPYCVCALLPPSYHYGFAGDTDFALVAALTLWNYAPLITNHAKSLMAGVIIALIIANSIRKYVNGTPQASSANTKDVQAGKPLLIPCQTTHTRFFPKKHSFAYSYLQAGVPIGWNGPSNPMLSEKSDASPGSWYTVDAADYLDRGSGWLGLDGKLRRYLESEGIPPREYPYAYLITAPKFMGYSFNPVSFWYLYSVKKELSAMVLEVNNTFDERHIYLLKPAENEVEDVSKSEEMAMELEDLGPEGKGNARELPDLQELSRKPTRFTNSWAKDFHVSPFNSRKGSYSLVTYDPLYPSMTGKGPIDNTITLRSSKSHPKLVARIFSSAPAVDPLNLSFLQRMSFLASYWWVGFVTFPRIVREAGKLFFRRKLHVWYRPEVRVNSLPRHADHSEKVLEHYFRSYLRHLVEVAETPMQVRYTAAGIRDFEPEVMTSPSAQLQSENAAELDFKVLSPLFYTRFIHYAHDLEAFSSEFLDNQTIYLSNPSLLPKLIIRAPLPAQATNSRTSFYVFKAIQKLRQLPPRISIPGKQDSMPEPTRKKDIRIFRLSAMDGFVLSEYDKVKQKVYCQEVLKVLLSDYVALGIVQILDAQVFLVRFGFALIVARAIGLLCFPKLNRVIVD